MQKNKKYILWYNEVSNQDVVLVGGKNASLGEMYQKLSKAAKSVNKKINMPFGFAVTAHAYKVFIESAGIKDEIYLLLKQINKTNTRDLETKAAKIRKIIIDAELPNDIIDEISSAYQKLSKFYKVKNLDVAVRSSATAEDLPTASFAGQQESFLNITGQKDLIVACKKCFASLFTNRAISYRVDKGFKHEKVYLSIGVQKMIRSDKASAGVLFTIDTETGFKDAVLINSSYGLGEYVVKGVVTPDEFFVFKTTLEKGFKPIIGKQKGSKKQKLIYSDSSLRPTINKYTDKKERQSYSLSEKEIITLAEWGTLIEKHYKMPMDIEWAKDGIDNKLYIVQARPETVESQKDQYVLETFELLEKGTLLASGNSVGAKIGQGKANVIKSVSQIEKFKKGEVLVTDMTDPDWEPIMKIASAIVTNRGGRTCHAAIVSRELGIPCLVGTKDATKNVKQRQDITVSCSEGEIGNVYKGILKFKINKLKLKNKKRPKTQIMQNIGEPELAFTYSFIPNDGVGLAREEFIINNYIKVHPLALLNFNKVTDKSTKDKINKLTAGYDKKEDYFVDKLAEGIGRIGAAFYPKDVIVRLSDFKTNEYANLIGGKYFEPHENNPMLGWRGASRYYDPKYLQAFKLECKALKKTRDVFGLKNIKIMIPFCRTIEEGKKVLSIMKQNGLIQGKDGLEVYVMCEIPSNIILADEFAKLFDGFSIGTNDLTQLVLGVDRDSELVSHIYDERNKAVKDMLIRLLKIAKKHKTKVGICGQAPSDFPEFADFLVRHGIDSISLTPDTVMKTTLRILKLK